MTAQQDVIIHVIIYMIHNMFLSGTPICQYLLMIWVEPGACFHQALSHGNPAMAQGYVVKSSQLDLQWVERFPDHWQQDYITE